MPRAAPIRGHGSQPRPDRALQRPVGPIPSRSWKALSVRHRGNEIILFHILDEAEVHFPFEGVVEFADIEDDRKMTLYARGMCVIY